MFVLDQSIGHAGSFLRVANQLQKLYPQWSSQVHVKTDDAIQREDAEQADAAYIIVPSRFVASTLEENGIDLSKVRVNPFGVDLDCFAPAPQPIPADPLRFIFAGSLQPRKGLPLLLDTWRQIQTKRRIELWIAGSGELPTPVRSTLPDNVRLIGKMTRQGLANTLRECQVFVFPSYFEGLAQVQIEAAACGLPVIGTTSSGCEEIIDNGEMGFVLKTGDGEQLRSALLAFIDDPGLSLRMRQRLLERRQQWSWNAYGDRWAKILEEVCG
jgi:glycosyltransferase involved in cell wall biosynthesis